MSFSFRFASENRAAAKAQAATERSNNPNVPHALLDLIDSSLNSFTGENDGPLVIEASGHVATAGSGGRTDLTLKIYPKAHDEQTQERIPATPPLDENGDRTDGPTFEGWLERGLSRASYPPAGFAPVPSKGWTEEQERRDRVDALAAANALENQKREDPLEACAQKDASDTDTKG